MLYYAAMSTVGSVLGCSTIDVTLRLLGAHGLEKHLPARRLKRVESKVRDNAGKALAIASLAPPPFPFTAFVMAAAALQYWRKRLLAVVVPSRSSLFARWAAWCRFMDGYGVADGPPCVPVGRKKPHGAVREAR